MKIIFDFDDTIFNTHALMQEILKVFVKKDFSENQFWNAFKECKEKAGDFDKGLLIDLLHEVRVFDKKKASVEVDHVIGKSNEFVYRDFFDFISSFIKKDLILLSFGASDFQKVKIENSGIIKYFHEIIIISKNKADDMEEIQKKYNEKLIFIDDKVQQIDEVKKRLPGIVAIKMERSNKRYIVSKSELAEFTVKKLDEAKEIIKKLNN